MKITRLRTQVVHLPIDPPILTAILGNIVSADCVLTFLETDEGLIGEGLVCTINNRRLGVIHEMIRNLEDLVIGLDPNLGGGLNARAWKELNFLGYEGVSIVGLAAIDNALWDLRGKAAGLNVAHLIGACRAAVPCYASGGLWLSGSDRRSAEAGDALRAARLSRDEDTGRPARAGRDGRPRARDTRGDRPGHRPDGRRQPADDRQAGNPHRADDGGPEPDLVRGAGDLPRPRRRGADRRGAGHADCLRRDGLYASRHAGMLQARAADVVMPDLQRMGGPTEFLKAGHLCEAFNVPCASHLFPEMSLALLAALPGGYYLEHMPWFEKIYREQIVLDSNGDAVVPDRPGWGFSFDPDAVRRFAA